MRSLKNLLASDMGNIKKPKFRRGQIVKVGAPIGEYVQIVKIEKRAAVVCGYCGEYFVSLSELRPLTRREIGASGGKKRAG